MTVKELRKVLEAYPEDTDVTIGIEGFDEELEVDGVENNYGNPCLVNTLTSPTAYGLRTYAEAYYNDGIGRNCGIDEMSAFWKWKELL